MVRDNRQQNNTGLSTNVAVCVRVRFQKAGNLHSYLQFRNAVVESHAERLVCNDKKTVQEEYH